MHRALKYFYQLVVRRASIFVLAKFGLVEIVVLQGLQVIATSLSIAL